MRLSLEQTKRHLIFSSKLFFPADFFKVWVQSFNWPANCFRTWAACEAQNMYIRCSYIQYNSPWLWGNNMIFILNTIGTSNIRKLYRQQNYMLCWYSDKVHVFHNHKDYMGTHASMLFELKEFISNRVGFVMRLYVASSSCLTSPPNMRGDLAIDHRVICEDKICQGTKMSTWFFKRTERTNSDVLIVYLSAFLIWVKVTSSMRTFIWA